MFHLFIQYHGKRHHDGHAVSRSTIVPSKPKSCQMIEAARNGNKNAHTIEKHGKLTTNEQQKRRANEGIEPDGTPSYKNGFFPLAQECGYGGRDCGG